MLKLIYIIALIFCASFTLQSQSEIDSLLLISKKYMLKDRVKFEEISNKVIRLSKKEKNDSTLTIMFNTKAMLAFLSKDYNKAIKYYDSTLLYGDINSRQYIEAQMGKADIYPKLNYDKDSILKYHYSIIDKIKNLKDSSLISSEYSNFGNYLITTSNLPEGIQYLTKAIEYAKFIYPKMMNMAKIANLFLQINNLEKADYYAGRAYKIAEDKKYKIRERKLTVLIARIAMQKGKFSEADSLLHLALNSFINTDTKTDIFSTFIYLSNLEILKNNYNRSRKYLDKAEPYQKYSKNQYDIGLYYILNALVDLKAGNYTESSNNLNIAYQYSSKTKNIFQEGQYLKIKAALESKKKNFKTAMELQNKYHQIKDSIAKLQNTSIIYDIEAKYQNKQKEKEIEVLRTKNKLTQMSLKQARFQKNLILAGSFFGLLLIVFLVVTYYKVKEKNKIIQKTSNQKDILMKEIHHRVKNNLQLMSSLLNLQSKYIKDEKAKQVSLEGKTRVRAMSLIHQFLYQKDDLVNLSLDEYFKRLVKELFEIYNIPRDNITTNYNIDTVQLDVDKVIPIGLIFNELITNILKYAFPDKNGGTIFISIKKSNLDLIMIVKDNGIGYSEDDSNNSSSFGYTLIRALLDKWDGKMQILHKEGTEVKIFIPNILDNNK